tara:strand:+ start:1331 stop:1642 length:312 start_codon:yes stop_codon:yes gene_type:complete
MKAGDLVTLSAYSEGLADLYKFAEHRRKMDGKPPLIGLVVRKEVLSPDQKVYKYCKSENDKTRYYINWMNKDCPVSRYGSARHYMKSHAYFLRKDLKYVRGNK